MDQKKEIKKGTKGDNNIAIRNERKKDRKKEREKERKRERKKERKKERGYHFFLCLDSHNFISF